MPATIMPIICGYKAGSGGVRFIKHQIDLYLPGNHIIMLRKVLALTFCINTGVYCTNGTLPNHDDIEVYKAILTQYCAEEGFVMDLACGSNPLFLTTAFKSRKNCLGIESKTK